MIRRLSNGLVFLISSSAFAGVETLGTKKDAISAATSSAASGGSVWSILQSILVLGVVLFLLKAVAPKLIAKFSKKLVSSTNGQIKIEESATFAGGSLYVVEARGKSLLLCVGSNGVTCLSELETKPVTAEQPLFMDIVEKEIQVQQQPNAPTFTTAVVEMEEAPVQPSTKGTLLRNPEIETLRKKQAINA